MKLHRFHLVPESAWRTPWQSDTLSGMLCGAIARLEGADVLRDHVINPAMAGRPPFVLSDALPGDRFPVPFHVRRIDCPPQERKALKRARWISTDGFQSLQRGDGLALPDLFGHDDCFHESAYLHNTISRVSNTTGDSGSLYAREECLLAHGIARLTVFVRVRAEFRELFWRAVQELATTGFGADRSAGKGQFHIDGALEPTDFLDNIECPTSAFLLSTFQPAANDPSEGAWDAFTKYGKLGPEFGLENVFKRPLVLLKAGAVFQTTEARTWFGRAIPMQEILAEESCRHLRERSIEIVHYGFGLAIPAVWRIDQPIQTEWPRRTVSNPPITPDRPHSSSRKSAALPAAKLADDVSVSVTLLERMEKTGPHAFRVQEADKPRGVLNHGTPPSPLPEAGATVKVFREPSSHPSNPTYRWSPLPSYSKRDLQTPQSKKGRR